MTYWLNTSVQYNPMEQIHANIKQQQMPTFKDNLALHHIDQEGEPPSTMQQLPHTDHHDLAPLSDILEFSPNSIIQENMIFKLSNEFLHYIFKISNSLASLTIISFIICSLLHLFFFLFLRLLIKLGVFVT